MKKTLDQDKRWLYKAAAILSVNGGFINSMTFVSFFHDAVGYVTGNITFAAAYLDNSETLNFMHVLGAVGAFLLGAIISGLIIPHDDYSSNNRYNTVLVVQIALIIFGTVGLIFQNPASEYILAMAMGLQNAYTTHYSKSIMRTTHMTGTATDIGIMIAHKIKRYDTPTHPLLLRLCLLLGFFAGSVFGIIAYKMVGYYGLLFSVMICMLMIKFQFASMFNSNLNC